MKTLPSAQGFMMLCAVVPPFKKKPNGFFERFRLRETLTPAQLRLCGRRW